MAPAEEKDVLFRLRKGEEQAFSRVFFWHYKPLCLFAAKFVPDLEDAKDIVSAVMLKLWENRPDFESLRQLKAYLYQAVHNGCANFRSAASHAGERQLEFTQRQETLQASYLHEITRAEAMMQLYRAIDALPEQAGKIINMTYLQEKSNQEAADALNLSVNTVKFQKRRGLALLRQLLSSSRLPIIVTAAVAWWFSD